MAGFGVPFLPVPRIVALFDTYPIGTPLQIGMDSGYWRGQFGGIQDGVALLTNAFLFSNISIPPIPIDGVCAVVRIPIRAITFVSQ